MKRDLPWRSSLQNNDWLILELLLSKTEDPWLQYKIQIMNSASWLTFLWSLIKQTCVYWHVLVFVFMLDLFWQVWVPYFQHPCSFHLQVLLLHSPSLLLLLVQYIFWIFFLPTWEKRSWNVWKSFSKSSPELRCLDRASPWHIIRQRMNLCN